MEATDRAIGDLMLEGYSKLICVIEYVRLSKGIVGRRIANCKCWPLLYRLQRFNMGVH